MTAAIAFLTVWSPVIMTGALLLFIVSLFFMGLKGILKGIVRSINQQEAMAPAYATRGPTR